jgi:hypothetical protein
MLVEATLEQGQIEPWQFGLTALIAALMRRKK